MNVPAKELRKSPGKILRKVSAGEQVVVTYRGKKLAKFVRIEPVAKTGEVDGKDEIFGLWKNHESKESVDKLVRRLRQSRSFDH